MADIHLRQPIRSKEDCHCKINHSDTLSETEKLSDKKKQHPESLCPTFGVLFFPFDEITYIPSFATSQPSGSNPSSVCLYSLASFICHIDKRAFLHTFFIHDIAINGKLTYDVGTPLSELRSPDCFVFIQHLYAVFFTCCYKGHEGQGTGT